jgi:CFEM domain.
MKVPTTYIFVATTVLLVAGVLAQDPIPSAAVTPSATTDSDVPNCTALALKIIPFCAQPCFIEAGSNLGCTGSDMIACQCRQADKLRSVVDGCVKSSCQPDEVQKVLDGSSKGKRTIPRSIASLWLILLLTAC